MHHARLVIDAALGASIGERHELEIVFPFCTLMVITEAFLYKSLDHLQIYAGLSNILTRLSETQKEIAVVRVRVELHHTGVATCAN